ncbi:MAG: radical SAM protein [Anaerolineae bacterium]|nr:radical SAM protein [Anaerolineae bacterium]
MIRVSIGTAGVLGLVKVPMAVAPTTAYLLVGDRCVMNCAFCAQAHESHASGDALSRVTWPAYPTGKVVGSLRKAEIQGTLQRCCIQVTAGQEAYVETLRLVRRIRRSVFLPLSVAILPANVQQVEELIEAGVDALGLGLDAATERVFRETKGLHWAHMIDVIEQVADRFPGIGSVHLIVGLGESERELVERMVWVRDLGLRIGLFAFTPVRGTPLADRPPPALGRYRRMQAARWLIQEHGVRLTTFTFGTSGTLTRIHHVGWIDALSSGEAFRTAGCPSCNRPFYNERPGGTMYNYARPLTAEEAAAALVETELVEGT